MKETKSKKGEAKDRKKKNCAAKKKGQKEKKGDLENLIEDLKNTVEIGIRENTNRRQDRKECLLLSEKSTEKDVQRLSKTILPF